MTVDVLITGSAGFVGEALALRLLSEGRTVAGVDLRAGAVPTRRMDVTDAAEVRAVIGGMRPSVVVHAAAIVDDRVPRARMFEVNVGGTEHVLAACVDSGVRRCVHVSSIAALGLDPGPRADERSPVRTDQNAAYFDSKGAAEQVVARFRTGAARSEGALEVAVVRPGDVWGPRSEPWVQRPLAMMQARQPMLIGGGRGYIAHCHIDNLVDALVLAIDHPDAIHRHAIVHDGERTTYRAYFHALADRAGLPRPRVQVPAPIALAAAMVAERLAGRFGTTPPMTEGAVRYLLRDTAYDLGPMRALGWNPRVTLAEGMAALEL